MRTMQATPPDVFEQITRTHALCHAKPHLYTVFTVWFTFRATTMAIKQQEAGKAAKSETDATLLGYLSLIHI